MQNFKKFSQSTKKDSMSNQFALKGMALASLDTHALAQLYHNCKPSRTSLPRDFMINTLLVREFGQVAYDDHAHELATQYPAYINQLRGSLVQS